MKFIWNLIWCLTALPKFVTLISVLLIKTRGLVPGFTRDQKKLSKIKTAAKMILISKAQNYSPCKPNSTKVHAIVIICPISAKTVCLQEKATKPLISTTISVITWSKTWSFTWYNFYPNRFSRSGVMAFIRLKMLLFYRYSRWRKFRDVAQGQWCLQF